MEGSHEWHGIPPNDAPLARALAQLPEKHRDYWYCSAVKIKKGATQSW